MSHHRICGGGEDSNPSDGESQVRDEGELHSFCSKDDIWVPFGV